MVVNKDKKRNRRCLFGMLNCILEYIRVKNKNFISNNARPDKRSDYLKMK